MTERRRLYLLDTNVLMHDPTSLFRFAEHDIFLPMIVLEELDRAKKGVTEVARNVRQASRFIGHLMGEDADLEQGLALREPDGLSLKVGTGRLYFQTEPVDQGDPLLGDSSVADNKILLAALNLSRRHPDCDIILVSKDINLRIKAAIHGIKAEDYHNDRALDDLSLLYTGVKSLEANFWDLHEPEHSWTEEGRTFYRIARAEKEDWYPNQCLQLAGENGLEALVRRVATQHLVLEVACDYRRSQQDVWGIQARNPEQNFALNLLMDPQIDFVTLLGTAGTGKTLLALAAGLAQTLDLKIYREITRTRQPYRLARKSVTCPAPKRKK